MKQDEPTLTRPWRKKTVLIMADGTGGHVYPALAIAKALQQQGFSIYWLGVRGRLGERVIPKLGIPFLTLPTGGIRGRSVFARMKTVVMLGISVFKAGYYFIRLKPSLVLGMGGYPTVPGGLAAKLFRVPLLLHEQNAKPGLANRFLARFASKVMTAFPDVLTQHGDILVTGNPLRSEFSQTVLTAPGASQSFRILVLGGSLGAGFLNQVVPQALQQVAAQHANIQVTHQTGDAQVVDVKQLYQAADIQATVSPFLDPVAPEMAAADLVIARAGAMTIAELTCLGKPSILVPLPSAVDDHQTANASFLTKQSAAILLPQSELTPAVLATKILELVRDPAKCDRMGGLARQLSQPFATEKVLNECTKWIA